MADVVFGRVAKPREALWTSSQGAVSAREAFRARAPIRTQVANARPGARRHSRAFVDRRGREAAVAAVSLVAVAVRALERVAVRVQAQARRVERVADAPVRALLVLLRALFGDEVGAQAIRKHRLTVGGDLDRAREVVVQRH